MVCMLLLMLAYQRVLLKLAKYPENICSKRSKVYVDIIKGCKNTVSEGSFYMLTNTTNL